MLHMNNEEPVRWWQVVWGFAGFVFVVGLCVWVIAGFRATLNPYPDLSAVTAECKELGGKMRYYTKSSYMTPEQAAFVREVTPEEPIIKAECYKEAEILKRTDL